MSDPLKWGSVGELNHVDWDAIVGELSPTLVAESGYNLHGLDLQSMAYEDVYAATMEAFPNIPVPCTRLKVGTILHRARPNENSRPYSRIKDITAPCSEKILKINRANREHDRVFYAGLDRDTALLEISPEHGMTSYDVEGSATVGIWEVMQDASVVTIWGTTKAAKRDPVQTERLAASLISEMGVGDSLHDQERLGVVVCLQGHLGVVFASKPTTVPDGYKLSAAYAQRLLDGLPSVQGIKYPSVAAAYEIDNVALRGSFANRALRLTQAHHVEYRVLGGEKTVQAEHVGSAIPDGEELRWQNHD
jgi:hypothetical protein